jgi:hypothetical protein
MFNLSAYYTTKQVHDLARVREMLPDAAIYQELCHCTTTTPNIVKTGYDGFNYMRTTDQQYYTAAHVAYWRGADGVSLFNFAYYREHGSPLRGPFNEPPFHVLKHLGKPDWVARQPQWNVHSRGNGTPFYKTFVKGTRFVYELDMSPTKHQRKDGVLRIMAEADMSDCKWSVKINGVTLSPIPVVLKPIAHPYEGGLGKAGQYACFKCPRAAVKEGVNRIDVRMAAGSRAKPLYMDIVLP